MITDSAVKKILFNPAEDGADTLLVLSGYASPNMASWYIKNLDEDKNLHLNEFDLIIGMTPYDGISVSAHEAFKEMQGGSFKSVNRFSCSYLYENPPIHGNLYIWSSNGVPVKAFTGSADFIQNSFLSPIKEYFEEIDPQNAMDIFNQAESRSIYCNHAEVEACITLRPTHQILDNEGSSVKSFAGEGIQHVSLSLLSRSGSTGEKSGLNWGQRMKRNKNEAYIPLPSTIAKSGFFPLNKQHFTVETDDGKTLILRVEQENNKAITTPLNNALLGEYFRNRLGLANGSYVYKDDLLRYGRTDVEFYKIDEEEYYMDFSV